MIHMSGATENMKSAAFEGKSLTQAVKMMI